MPRLTFVPVFALLLAVLGTAACDPEAPGATGSVTLAPGVDATAFQTLALRTFANESGPYDLSQPIPANAERDYVAAAGLTFPHHYSVGGGIGSSLIGDWQLVAWLSHRTPSELNQADGFDPGDALCSVAYHVRGCGAGTRGYCGVTAGVNCELAPLAQPGP
jgi:hypothetical protein